MLTQPELIEKLILAANGVRHKHYQHTVKKHTLYMQLIAGVGIDKLLRKFVRREDEVLFKQRVELTQHITKSICRSLLGVWNKIPRSPSGRRVLTYEGSTGVESKVKDLEGRLAKFWGAHTFDQYLAVRARELQAVDPNAFLVYEFGAFDHRKELLQPHPFEVLSANAVDFKYTNGILKFLTVKGAHTFDLEEQAEGIPKVPGVAVKTQKQKVGHKFTIYGQKETAQLLEVDERFVDLSQFSEDLTVYRASYKGPLVNGYSKVMRFVKIKDKVYTVKTFTPHNLGEVPAMRVGYLRDLETQGESFVNELDAVEPYLLKSITVNSHLDIVAALIAFPQRVRFGVVCKAIECNKGYNADDSKCTNCNGAGIEPMTPSTQDDVVFPMPQDIEDMPSLKDVIHHVHPEVAIIKWQDEYCDKLVSTARRMLFNTDVFDRKQIADTATGKHLDMSNVYDTLYPYAMHHSRMFVHGVRVCAGLMDRAKGLVVSYTYGKDFKLKTLDSLISDLSATNGLGNSALSKSLNDDIALILYSDQPLELQRYRARQMFNPFEGKSEKEVMLLMASDFTPLAHKVLWANLGNIFDAIEIEQAKQKIDFYQLNHTVQREIINEKVDEIIAELTPEVPNIEILG